MRAQATADHQGRGHSSSRSRPWQSLGVGSLHSPPGLQWGEPADCSSPVQSPQVKATKSMTSPSLLRAPHVGLRKNCFSSPTVGKYT